jgi:putative methyltransferase (TIGR04325 family)
MHRLIHDLCPPLVGRWYRQQRSGVPGWSGDYASWSEVESRCAGYDAPEILARIKESQLRVRAGQGAFERDSVVFPEMEYSWPALASLLHVAAVTGGSLRVLDFGGSLGSTYLQHRRWFDGIADVAWGVVEQAHFVHCGREHFQDQRLSFHETLVEGIVAVRPNVALLSSVLGYLRDPGAILREISESGIGHILIDRTGFTRDDRDRITLQQVPASIYPASYPCRFFSRSWLIGQLAPDYELVATFPALDDAPPFADFLGLFFTRRERPRDEKPRAGMAASRRPLHQDGESESGRLAL